MSSGWNPSQYYDDDEDDDYQTERSGRDATIFLIDCNQTMFDSDSEDSSSNFLKCINCIEAVMMNKIICSEKELLSIVLYNTQHSPIPKIDKDDFEEQAITVPANCAIFTILKPASVESINFVKNLKESEDLMDFSNVYGHSTSAKFSEIIWICSSMFAKCGYKLGVSSIQLFTNIDIPHPISSPEYQTTILKAKDLQQLNLDFRLIPMKEDFAEDFYKELYCTILNMPLDEFVMPTYEDEEESMLRRMFKKSYKQRAQTHLHFKLSKDLYFGVDIFGFVRKTKIPRPILRSRENNEPIISKRSFKYAERDPEEEIHDPLDLKEPLLPKLTVKYQEIGGEKVCFTPLEVFEMKQIQEPGIKLIGFKPLNSINPELHIKSTYFLYPSDDRIKNSSTLFRALWEKCLQKQKIAICIVTMRKKSNPKLVALVPQREEITETDDILRFDGFRMIQLPFAGDVRNLKLLDGPAPETNDEACDVIKKIIHKLTISCGFRPDLFENPVLRTIFANIESVCYSKEVEAIEDSTMPDIDRQDRKIGKLVDQLQELIGEFYIDKEAAKRKAREEAAANKAAKVPKLAVDAEVILDAIKNENMKPITVAALKSYCQDLGFTGLSKLTKDGLVDKIKEYHAI